MPIWGSPISRSCDNGRPSNAAACRAVASVRRLVPARPAPVPLATSDSHRTPARLQHWLHGPTDGRAHPRRNELRGGGTHLGDGEHAVGVGVEAGKEPTDGVEAREAIEVPSLQVQQPVFSIY